jgi:hypothetical protein
MSGVPEEDFMRVDVRPLRPPNPEESHCTTISQAAAIHATPVADAPLSRQGETLASPRPDPSATSTIDAAAATMAPPKMAGQVTAETEDSGVAGRMESRPVVRCAVNVSTVPPRMLVADGNEWLC